MKMSLLLIGLLGLLVVSFTDLRAQVYGPYYPPYGDVQYQQYLEWQRYQDYLRQIDPYYELHVMHYQLYLQRFQPSLLYPPCCYAVGIPRWSTPLRRVPHGPKSRAPKAIRRR